MRKVIDYWSLLFLSYEFLEFYGVFMSFEFYNLHRASKKLIELEKKNGLFEFNESEFPLTYMLA